jgi:hypothetical protein
VICPELLRSYILAYKELGKEVPAGNALIEQIAAEVEHVGQAT